MKEYLEDFYVNRYKKTCPTAREIIPIVLEAVQFESVVDVGCGVGAWLSVFREYGIKTILGIDSEWVEKKYLNIPSDCFLEHNLTKPLLIDREFDLAVSLEVAEHLPENCAETFVDSVTRLAPVVLFSAAIPFQGGVNHRNEQWPDYWAALFNSKGYLTVDLIRMKVWQNVNVLPHYAQNILLFVREDFLKNNILLKKEYEATSTSYLSVVHPRLYSDVIYGLQLKNMSFRKALTLTLKTLPIIALNAIKRRMKFFSCGSVR